MQAVTVPQIAVVRWRIVTPGTGAARGRAACSGLVILQCAQAHGRVELLLCFLIKKGRRSLPGKTVSGSLQVRAVVQVHAVVPAVGGSLQNVIAGTRAPLEGAARSDLAIVQGAQTRQRL